MPEDLQSILTDSNLHNATADLTTKDILSRYGDIVRGNVGKQTVQPADGPAQGPPSSAAGSSKSPHPMAQRVDVDPSQATAWQKQSSVRPVQNLGPPGQHGDFNFSAPRSPYAGNRTESPNSQSESGQGINSARASYQQKPGAMGVAS